MLKMRAILYWMLVEDFVTSYEEETKFDVSNEVIIEYYQGIDYSIVEVTGGEIGDHFEKLYEGEFIYLHVHDGKVVYIQQAIRIPY